MCCKQWKLDFCHFSFTNNIHGHMWRGPCHSFIFPSSEHLALILHQARFELVTGTDSVLTYRLELRELQSWDSPFRPGESGESRRPKAADHVSMWFKYRPQLDWISWGCSDREDRQQEFTLNNFSNYCNFFLSCKGTSVLCVHLQVLGMSPQICWVPCLWKLVSLDMDMNLIISNVFKWIG